MKLKEGWYPDGFNTAIKALNIEYRNNFTKDDKVAALVSAAGSQYGATILNKMERLESAEEEEEVTDVSGSSATRLLHPDHDRKGTKDEVSRTLLILY